MAPVMRKPIHPKDGSPVSRYTRTRQFFITQHYIFGYCGEFPANEKLEFLNLDRKAGARSPPLRPDLACR